MLLNYNTGAATRGGVSSVCHGCERVPPPNSSLDRCMPASRTSRRTVRRRKGKRSSSCRVSFSHIYRIALKSNGHPTWSQAYAQRGALSPSPAHSLVRDSSLTEECLLIFFRTVGPLRMLVSSLQALSVCVHSATYTPIRSLSWVSRHVRRPTWQCRLQCAHCRACASC
jgi:hypothetical protein